MNVSTLFVWGVFLTLMLSNANFKPNPTLFDWIWGFLFFGVMLLGIDYTQKRQEDT